MFKKSLLAGLLAVIGFAAMAQDSTLESKQKEPKTFDKSRLFIGGNLGLSFGTYTFVNVSPQVGYRFNNHVAAGMGINFQYIKDKRYYGSYTNTVAGMNLFGRVYPIQQFFAQVQPELNYIWGKYDNGSTESSLNGKILPSLLLGAGGVVPMGRVGGLVILAQYDLLNKSPTATDPGTPYGKNIFFSIGFNVGL